jgi:hypothetical protein
MAYANDELFVSEAVVFGVTDIAVYDANTLQLKRRMDVNALPTFFGGLGGDGLGGLSQDWFRFSANAGDDLTLTADAFNAAEAGNSGEFQNGLMPNIALYDSGGNLVASATDDGTGMATIHYHVPAGAGGAYYVQLTSENDTLGEFVLHVGGNTGAPDAFVVTATDPAAGSHLASFSAMTFSFNESILLTSIDSSDAYVVNPDSSITHATGFSVLNGHTVMFTFPTLPTGSENGLEHDVHISGVRDLQGDLVQTDIVPIFLDNVPPQVASSNINNGDTVPSGTVDFVVTFSEPMDTSLTNAGSFNLHDNVNNVNLSPTSFSWNATGTVLTIHYTYVSASQYTETLYHTGFADLVGNQLSGDYIVNFATHDVVTPVLLIDNTSSKFSTKGGRWNTASGGYLGSYVYHAPGKKSQTAAWTLNLNNGTYQLFVTWVALPGNATNATYQVFDRHSLLATIVVNQQVTPNSVFVNGTYWQSLGVFRTNSRLFTIELSAAANGTVIADAAFASLPLMSPTGSSGKKRAATNELLSFQPLADSGTGSGRDFTKIPATKASEGLPLGALMKIQPVVRSLTPLKAVDAFFSSLGDDTNTKLTALVNSLKWEFLNWRWEK